MNAMIRMNKVSKKSWVILIVLLALCGWYMVVAQPFKVRDPADPRFDPAKFRFEDYPGIPPMEDALRKLFPVGTPKEFVEKVLIDAGQAQLEQVVPKEQIEKNNRTWLREFPDRAENLVLPVRDKYIYGRTADYWFPTIMDRNWAVIVQYDENNKLSLLQLNGRPIAGEISIEEIKGKI